MTNGIIIPQVDPGASLRGIEAGRDREINRQGTIQAQQLQAAVGERAAQAGKRAGLVDPLLAGKLTLQKQQIAGGETSATNAETLKTRKTLQEGLSFALNQTDPVKREQAIMALNPMANRAFPEFAIKGEDAFGGENILEEANLALNMLRGPDPISNMIQDAQGNFFALNPRTRQMEQVPLEGIPGAATGGIPTTPDGLPVESPQGVVTTDILKARQDRALAVKEEERKVTKEERDIAGEEREVEEFETKKEEKVETRAQAFSQAQINNQGIADYADTTLVIIDRMLANKEGISDAVGSLEGIITIFGDEDPSALVADLAFLQARAGFEGLQLQKKQGISLAPISEKEFEFGANTVGNLTREQPEASFIRTLKTIKSSIINGKKAADNDVRKKFAKEIKAGALTKSGAAIPASLPAGSLIFSRQGNTTVYELPDGTFKIIEG